jgi:hypothetical protein
MADCGCSNATESANKALPCCACTSATAAAGVSAALPLRYKVRSPGSSLYTNSSVHRSPGWSCAAHLKSIQPHLWIGLHGAYRYVKLDDKGVYATREARNTLQSLCATCTLSVVSVVGAQVLRVPGKLAKEITISYQG